MRIDPLEELRELEGIARRQTAAADPGDRELLEIGSAEGAALQPEGPHRDRPGPSPLAGVAPACRGSADRRPHADVVLTGKGEAWT
jgi:hypothetical protein